MRPSHALAALSCLTLLAIAACAEPSRPAGVALTAAAKPAESQAPPSTSTTASAEPSPTPPEPPAAPLGVDLVAQTRELSRVAACNGSTSPPPPFTEPWLTGHCTRVGKRYTEYRTRWLEPATAFLAPLRPSATMPVVYPFGGGDLTTALAVFPEATEFTTLSLEPAGDVRRVRAVKPTRVLNALFDAEQTLGVLLTKAYNTSARLDYANGSDLPGELVLSLGALALHGFEPVSLRYFRIADDGALHYLEGSDLEAPRAFANMELAFRRAGDEHAKVRRLRHIATNLDDAHFSGSAVEAHLKRKGHVHAMTKAAIHLLARADFSALRGFLLENIDWMISDSTGLPLRMLAASGLEAEAYGGFLGPAPYGGLPGRDTQDLVALFKQSKAAKLPFRIFGYGDVRGEGHLIVAKRIAISAR